VLVEIDEALGGGVDEAVVRGDDEGDAAPGQAAAAGREFRIQMGKEFGDPVVPGASVRPGSGNRHGYR
jgi:hypothetical protein